MSFGDKVVEEYKKAFHDLHETYPHVEKRGAWININGKNYRAKEVLRMIINLDKRRVEEKYKKEDLEENAKSMDFFIKPNGWEKHIKKDLIVSLLNKLYELNGKSSYDLEKFIKNFTPSDFVYRQEEFEKLHEEMKELKRENLDLLRKKYNLEFINKVLKRDMEKDSKIIDSLKKNIKIIKEKSVFFSMDDIP